MSGCNRRKQVRRERGDAALARQVVADKRDFANLRTFFHKPVLVLKGAKALWVSPKAFYSIINFIK
jgi:hypothetical protein